VLPLVTRREEEEALHACRPGERPCINDARCAGAAMPGGSTLPRFKAWAECVLCLRARVLADWLEGLGEPQTRVLQPYRVSVGPDGYAEEATIQPVAELMRLPARDPDDPPKLVPVVPCFDGVTDPFVRFCPERLRWAGDTVDQSSLHYRLRPSVRHAARPPEQVFFGGRLDVWRELLRCGLFCPRFAGTKKVPPRGILAAMQAALWARDPALDKKSTWVASLVEQYGAAPVVAVRRRIVDAVGANPVLLAEARRRHPRWDEYAAAVPVQPKLDAKRARLLVVHQETFAAFLARAHRRGRLADAEPPQLDVARAMHAKGTADAAVLAHVRKRDGPGVRLLPAPAHWPELEATRVQCACVSCHSYKGAELYAPKAFFYGDGEHHMFGQRGVAFSLVTNQRFCFKKNKGRKGPKRLRETCAPLVDFHLGGSVLELFGSAAMPCSRCAVLCPRLCVQDVFTCGQCVDVPEPRCLVCGAARENMREVTVFEDGARAGVSTVFLCDKDCRKCVDTYEVWSLPALAKRLRAEERAELTQRRTPAVKRRQD